MNTSQEIITVANALLSVAQCMAESQSQSLRTRKIAHQYVQQLERDIEYAKSPRLRQGLEKNQQSTITIHRHTGIHH